MTKVPFNKGDAYEEEIFLILKNRGLIPTDLKRAGACTGTDVIFLHNGEPFNLEVKNGTGADYGQCMLRWENGEWIWSVDNDVTRFYTEIGVLNILKGRNVTPIKFNKPNNEITVNDRTKDRRAFEKRIEIPTKALMKFYSGKKVFYIQIGDGFGFFHLEKDVANLGTEQFKGKMLLRFRAKTIRSEPSWNYGFYAVLKVGKIFKKSRFSFEPSGKQKFPPIMP